MFKESGSLIYKVRVVGTECQWRGLFVISSDLLNDILSESG